jgi:hypothetical protein
MGEWQWQSEGSDTTNTGLRVQQGSFQDVLLNLYVVALELSFSIKTTIYGVLSKFKKEVNRLSVGARYAILPYW